MSVKTSDNLNQISEKLKKNRPRNKGINFFEALTLLFIGLKLGNVIAWSWWWVLSPLWLPIVIFLAVAILIFFIIWIAEVSSGK